jgi:hypothetical protein
VLCAGCGAELKPQPQPRPPVVPLPEEPARGALPGGWSSALTSFVLELVCVATLVIGLDARSVLAGLISLGGLVAALVYAAIATFGRGHSLIVRCFGLLLAAVALMAIWGNVILLLLSQG